MHFIFMSDLSGGWRDSLENSDNKKQQLEEQLVWFSLFVWVTIRCKKTKMQINENKSICFRDRSSTLRCLDTDSRSKLYVRSQRSTCRRFLTSVQQYQSSFRKQQETCNKSSLISSEVKMRRHAVCRKLPSPLSFPSSGWEVETENQRGRKDREKRTRGGGRQGSHFITEWPGNVRDEEREFLQDTHTQTLTLTHTKFIHTVSFRHTFQGATALQVVLL